MIKKPWKKKCPTFSMVIDKIADYFKMDVKATRFNWYRDSSEWKPYHHDAAAVKYNRASKTQNFTAGVSFGTERDAAFQHAKTKTVVTLPQVNGCVYTFGRDVTFYGGMEYLKSPLRMKKKMEVVSLLFYGDGSISTSYN
ncbi:unnamed protein product [Lepeophtheirus salmonis]|uniref:(salmon louse) hypothetical protein n=1 Tax=Lepeophtheirus salmonis TaxID=72036 RepID=A0A7R8CED2_LEPSM|nr:unnamed protein product [Lepeophtheirus salmonis]CAF2794345.1 unnamed protein product [Lepeophtheirus salmonis]